MTTGAPSSLAALAEAIVAAPLATAPRRAYARAIAAHDPARAEHIATSIAALACRLAARGDTPACDALAVRAARLERTHRARWLPSEPDVQLFFERGFPEGALTTTTTWAARAAELRARYPLLALEARGPARALAGHLGGLRALTLLGDQGPGDLQAVLDDAACDDLVYLDLSHTGLGAAAARCLDARAPKALRYVELGPAWSTPHDGAYEVVTPALFYPYPDLEPALSPRTPRRPRRRP